MAKKKLTLEKIAQKLTSEGAETLPLNEETIIAFYTRTIFETVPSESNIFQPTTQKQKLFIPSYFLVTKNEFIESNNLFCATIFNISNKTILNKDFVTFEIIDFFNQHIF